MEVQISVIVPVYNVEKFLAKCINSILNQTEKDFEVILVNDGSKDASGEICDSYARQDKRIRVFHRNNEGVSVARNYGIKQAKGKYIVFVDSDDWIEEYYLECLLKNMKPKGMSICSYYPSDKKEGIECMSREEAQLSVYSSFGMGGVPYAKMFDAELIKTENIKFIDEIGICEDLIFVIQYISVMESEAIWEHVFLYNYRINSCGALIGRYFQKIVNPKTLTEFEGIKLSEKWILNKEKTQDAYRTRAAKGACNTLRTMVANKYIDKDMYIECLTYVRKNLWQCCTYSGLAKSSKISLLLCAISPRIEWEIWKYHNAKHRE